MAAPASRSDLPVTLADIEAAAGRIRGAVVRTPTVFGQALSDRLEADIFVKLENLQATGSFKERGALNKLLLMDEATRARGVIAASAGNHAQAVACHASRLGVPATIVMPSSTPMVKVAQTQGHGATVVLHGDIFDEAYAHALTLSEERGLTFLHPFDDQEVIAGQGTIAFELLADVPDLDTLVIPIGGGGLIAGIGTAAKALKPDIELIGVQAELYPSMYAKFARRPIACGGDTLAEGIAVKAPGLLTAGIINHVVDDMLLVPERDLETAVSLLIRLQKTVAEGAGAAGLAALVGQPERFRGRKIGLVVSGGNMDTRLLATVLMRDLVRAGRMARLRIEIQDRPGALVSVMRLFGEHGANIVEIYHHRVFSKLPAKDAVIDVECEARDADQLDRLIAALKEDGFPVHPIEIE
jgi:threonine dehydratase